MFYVNAKIARHYGKSARSNFGAGFDWHSYGPFGDRNRAAAWARRKGILPIDITEDPKGRVMEVKSG
jgi:hypothetical protein